MSGVTDGQNVDAAITNAAFLFKNGDDTVSNILTFNKEQILKFISTPSNPSSGYIKVYSKSDGALYQLSSSGTESQISSSSPTTDPLQRLNLGLSVTMASNAATIALKTSGGGDPSASDVVKIGFRSSTATNGAYNIRSVSAALSTVISSGSTGGTVSAVPQTIHIYAIDFSGTVELAWANQRWYDEGVLYNITAEGGGGGADSALIIYGTTARTAVPIRYIGSFTSTQATAGTWATSPTYVTVTPSNRQPQLRSQVRVYQANGYGSTNNKIRRFSSIQDNYGTAITYSDSAANGGLFTINENGLYTISYCEDFSASGALGISLNSSQLTTGITSITAADRLIRASTPAADTGAFAGWTGNLLAGDLIRAHTGGTTTGANPATVEFTICKIND